MTQKSNFERDGGEPPGTTIGGKYHVDRIVGLGGSAVVYGVTHRNGAELAVKMLHRALSTFGDIQQRFMREGYLASSVKHSGVVNIVDDGTTNDGAAFLVMELLRGQSVEALVAERGGRLPVQAAVAIADQLLAVLAAAHDKGIVHRDIKPANVFLTLDASVKIVDFRIARASDALVSIGAETPCTGAVLGTPAFMPIEQALGTMGDVDAQSDLWAVAATPAAAKTTVAHARPGS